MNSGETKLVFPGLAGFYESVRPYGYPIIRFAAGAVFMYHGYAKLFLGFAPFVAKNILTPMGFPIPMFSPTSLEFSNSLAARRWLWGF